MSVQFGVHTADVVIRVTAKTLPELFNSALRGMNDILKPGFCDTFCHSDCIMNVEITARDSTNLLVDFLSEVLTLSYVHKAIFCNAYFSEFSENHLVAQLFGAWFTKFDEEVKSATYHEADVRQNDNGSWETTIIFDV